MPNDRYPYSRLEGIESSVHEYSPHDLRHASDHNRNTSLRCLAYSCNLWEYLFRGAVSERIPIRGVTYHHTCSGSMSRCSRFCEFYSKYRWRCADLMVNAPFNKNLSAADKIKSSVVTVPDGSNLLDVPYSHVWLRFVFTENEVQLISCPHESARVPQRGAWGFVFPPDSITLSRDLFNGGYPIINSILCGCQQHFGKRDDYLRPAPIQFEQGIREKIHRSTPIPW